MRRDSIFYKLFQQYPRLLFDLLPDPPENAAEYRFDSVSVKEPTFAIDGVFLPPDAGILYFCEVQFQKDKVLYERILAETSLYFYRNRSRFTDWRIVVIYPDRKTEQSNYDPYRFLVESEKMIRIYLDELPDVQELPLELALMKLATLRENEAIEQARILVQRVRQETIPAENRAILELVTTILSYRFTNMSRDQIENLMDVRLQDTRIYREIREEVIEEGRAEGRAEGQRSVISLLLAQKFGTLPDQIQAKVSMLTTSQLEAIALHWSNFSTLADLETWLEQQSEESL